MLCIESDFVIFCGLGFKFWKSIQPKTILNIGFFNSEEWVYMICFFGDKSGYICTNSFNLIHLYRNRCG